jgi:hypothetical protein
MAFTDGHPVWRVIRIAALVMFLVLAVGSFAIGQWLVGGLLAFGAVFLLLARLPLFRLAVTREPDAILCRYVPWYEPAPYLANSMLLVLGVGSVVAGFRADFGPMMAILGVVMLVLLPVGVAKFWRRYRRCRLLITPAALTVPDPAQGYAELTIPRQCVLSIAPRAQTTGFGSTELTLTEITYQDTGGARTVCVGPAAADDTVWLTVTPANLLVALQDWNNADPADPGLLNRLEAVLRSRDTAAVAGPTTGGAHPVAAGTGPGAPGSPAATPVPQLPGAPGPRRARRVSGGPLSLLLVVSALGAGYPLYHHLHRDPVPEHSVTVAPQVTNPSCPAPGAEVVQLPRKSDAEPAIELPLAPGWEVRDINDPRLADDPDLRGFASNPAITEGDPFINITLRSTTDAGASGPSLAEEVFTKARKKFPTVTQSSATVCGQTVYRFDTAGNNPDGNGEQTATTVFSFVDKGGSLWMALASLKTTSPDNPAYIAQRDALAAGFHVTP